MRKEIEKEEQLKLLWNLYTTEERYNRGDQK